MIELEHLLDELFAEVPLIRIWSHHGTTIPIWVKEYGTFIDIRCEHYRAAENDEVLYPVLATWMIIRMILVKSIPLYVNISSYRAIVKYESQRPTCRLCDYKNSFSNNHRTVRRNREVSISEKSRAAENSHVEQAANADRTTFQENIVSHTELSEGILVEPVSERNESTETET